MTTAQRYPTAVEVLTLPLDQLLAAAGIEMAEIGAETLGEHTASFLGVLIRRPGQAPLLGLPADQDDQQRDDVIRMLLIRELTPVAEQERGERSAGIRQAADASRA